MKDGHTVWLIEYRIDGKWQHDGEWHKTKGGAKLMAKDDAFEGWDWRIRRAVVGDVVADGKGEK